MKMFIEKFAKISSAVAFAEQAEYDDAARMADGSFEAQAADGKQVEAAEKNVERRSVDHRPRLRL